MCFVHFVSRVDIQTDYLIACASYRETEIWCPNLFLCSSLFLLVKGNTGTVGEFQIASCLRFFFSYGKLINFVLCV